MAGIDTINPEFTIRRADVPNSVPALLFTDARSTQQTRVVGSYLTDNYRPMDDESVVPLNSTGHVTVTQMAGCGHILAKDSLGAWRVWRYETNTGWVDTQTNTMVMDPSTSRQAWRVNESALALPQEPRCANCGERIKPCPATGPCSWEGWEHIDSGNMHFCDEPGSLPDTNRVAQPAHDQPKEAGATMPASRNLLIGSTASEERPMTEEEDWRRRAQAFIDEMTRDRGPARAMNRHERIRAARAHGLLDDEDWVTVKVTAQFRRDSVPGPNELRGYLIGVVNNDPPCGGFRDFSVTGVEIAEGRESTPPFVSGWDGDNWDPVEDDEPGEDIAF